MNTHVKIEAPVSEIFIQGPIPMEWLSHAAALPGKTLNVAIALWWLRSLSGGGTVSLSHDVMRLLNVSRETASEALERMEQAGLVSVVRAKGRKHEITILTNAVPVVRTSDKQQIIKARPQPASVVSERRTLRNVLQA